jgi:hypothetical protein
MAREEVRSPKDIEARLQDNTSSSDKYCYLVGHGGFCRCASVATYWYSFATSHQVHRTWSRVLFCLDLASNKHARHRRAFRVLEGVGTQQHT